MPELSGPDFVHELKRARPDVRVLFVSGYTDDEVVKRGVLAGETAFLQKPFAPAAARKNPGGRRRGSVKEPLYATRLI